jgi:hypothetical protein
MAAGTEKPPKDAGNPSKMGGFGEKIYSTKF